MAYAKYFYKNGKRFGPYYYESYRDNSGKVKKRYVGTIDPDNKGVIPTRLSRKLKKTYKRNKLPLLLILFLFGAFIFILLFFGFNKTLTGHAVLDISSEVQNNYSIGDRLNGSLVLTIQSGDLIQKDIIIDISLIRNESVLASREISFNDFLAGQVKPVAITNETLVCVNISAGGQQEVCVNESVEIPQEVCVNETVPSIVENCTSSEIFNEETNETEQIQNCINETINNIIENCTLQNITSLQENCTMQDIPSVQENCTIQTTTDYYFNQTGSYSKAIQDLINYTFNESGNYTLKAWVDSLGISSEKNIIVNQGERMLGILSTPGNIDACQELNVSGIYVMTRNLNGSDVNSTGCFNITTSNVELNCNGFFIRNTILAVPGIYAGDNLVNITIRNCNVTTSIGGTGIGFNYVNNSLIINNTANSNNRGIYLYVSSNNTLSGNTANSNARGIYLYIGSNNNQIINNTANSNYDGIYLSSSSNNTLINNTANLNTYGIELIISSNNNQIINNTANSNYNGIYLSSSSNNSLTNNNIWNCTDTTYGCIYLSIAANNNIFTVGLINLSSSNLIYISGSHNNILKDLILLGATKNDTFLTQTSINNTFLNVSYNSTKESVASGSQLIRKWYLDVNVSDGTNPLNASNVSAFNVSGSLQFSEFTNSSGQITRKELIEYVNTGSSNGINRTYYSNYSINISKSDYRNSSVSRNITGNTVLSVNMTSLYNLSSCGIIDSPGVYTMTRNLVDGDVNLTGCFNITASNVELNCNGFFIRNTSLSKPGIYAGGNLINITIRNCNVTMSNFDGGYGIYFNYVNNSFIINNTANSNVDGDGIFLSTSSNNNIINNTANSNTIGHGIYLYLNSNNNTLTGNTANFNYQGYGIFLYQNSSNNNIINNTLNFNSRGIYLLSSSNNQITNNTANSNVRYGISLSSGLNNTFTNNDMWNCTDTTFSGCLSLFSTSQNNTFTGGLINLSSSNLIYLTTNSNNNIFKDIILLNSNILFNDTFLTSNSINNTFINVSYNSSKESVGAGSQLIRKWYLDVNVSDGANAIVSANVSTYNVSGSLQFTELTNSSGNIVRKEVIEYVNTGATSGINRSYYSNYTINLSKIEYRDSSVSRNITGNSALGLTMSFIFNLSSCGVINSPGVYNMTKNLVDGDVNLTGCFNITSSNVELNCKGYFIRNTSLAVPGIYAGNNLVNITIRNCNVTMSASGYGIQFNLVNNSLIINNTANSNVWGIYLKSSSNNNLTGNIIDPVSRGIYLSSSSNNTIYGNNLGSSSEDALSILSGSDYNQIINNFVYSSISGNGIEIYSSSNYIFNNTIDSSFNGIYLRGPNSNNTVASNILNNNSKGIRLDSSSANNFTNNNMWNCTGTGASGCIYISSSQNNTITGGLINLSLSNLIYSESGSDNNIFKDITLLGATKNDTFLTATSINNTFINVSYNSSRESVASGSQLIRKWYLDVNVSDGTNPLNASNVSVFNVSGNLQFSELTNSTGQIARKEVIEYINTGSASGINRTYYSNYSINATKLDYRTSSIFRNITENTALSVTMSSLYNLSSCGIIDTPGVYNMSKNLVNGDVNSTGCFNITASNVELNCNGYFIRNTSLAVPGIYAGDNLVNITVRNCNVTMSTSGYGVWFNYVNNSLILNSTANSNYMGIYLLTSSNNLLINNTVNLNTGGGLIGYGIILLTNSNNNQIINNTLNSNYDGIYLLLSSNNTLTNNIANSNTYGIILLTNSNNNQIINNTLNSNYDGIQLSSSSNNNFTNNNIWKCIDPLYGCIRFLSTSQNNIITGGLINLSSTNLIYLQTNSNNNIFKDLTLLGATKNNTFLTSTSINNTFINVSYNNSAGKEWVASGSQLIRKWYLDVNVSDGTNVLSQATINSYNKSGSLLTSSLTNSSGLTRQELIEYVNIGSDFGINKSYYSNYSIIASKSGYYDNSRAINMSENKNISISLNGIPGFGSGNSGDIGTGGKSKNNTTNESEGNISDEAGLGEKTTIIETPFGFKGIRKGPVGCAPNWSCGEWSKCQITYNLNTIIGNSILLTGERLRVCKDMKDCAYDVIQKKGCDDKIPIIIKNGTGCYEGYIMIYDTNNQLISILNMKKTYQTILDIQIILDNSNYCPSCYNGIMDGDETDIDCGGSCGECSEISKGFNLSVFFEGKFIIFIFILTLFIFILIVYTFILFMRYLELKKMSKDIFKPNKNKPENSKSMTKNAVEVKPVDKKPFESLNKKGETHILNKFEEKEDSKREKEIKKFRRLWYDDA